jgi:hypothetical protein
MASKASATESTRASAGMASPARPDWWPLPSQRSWCQRITSTALPSDLLPATIWTAGSGWARMTSHSRASRGPGLLSTASGRPTLPTSCGRNP